MLETTESNKNIKVYGCLICGYRTDKPEEIERFRVGDYFCCRENIMGLRK